MASSTSAVNSNNLVIPLVNFSHFLHGTPSQRLSTAQAILHGFQTAGFIYLTHTPIPPSTLQTTFKTSASFFSRSQPYKEALGWTTPESNRGYVSHGREKTPWLRPARRHQT
ncbi:putative Sexual differentiation process protein isp7 [Glarea lozoyensis 74030]|uniref:Putative Sexual differentiation process protein isp7 n=1 Tax=Glarea lozoyensis (strain ATCC 74030 / MF5533) TaxID=1104152 RepID=H0EPU1_GLAL7|nr:putative Sexual differentiation process protein isp7 [Glarea lozoyensis 74030]